VDFNWFNGLYISLSDTAVSSVYSGYNVAIKLSRLIKVCVHAACSEVRTSKLLSHIFPVEKGDIAVIYALWYVISEVTRKQSEIYIECYTSVVGLCR
jgi:hypothetical protein